MTDVYRFSESEIIFFALVLVRMTGFVVTWPVFGTENVPQQLKILFCLIFAIVIFPTLHETAAQMEAAKSNLILLVIREAFIGVAMGYLSRCFFFTFRVAGEMMSQAMGLGSASLYNPLFGGQSTSLEQFYVGLASLFYLALNGHYLLISGLVSSFHFLPVAQLSLNTSQFSGLGQMVQEVFELGLKFSAPVVIAILCVNLILGVVGKTVPQLNVLVTSFPINIFIGFLLMFLTLPLLIDQMNDYLRLSTDQVFQFLKSF